jgi:hypothetical protein
VAWSVQAAALLRAGDFSRFTADDIEHLADEIEDVGKSEARELENRMAVLICHLLKWQYQPARRGSSWEKTIKVQRKDVLIRLQETPSLKRVLLEESWIFKSWASARQQAEKDTSIAFDVFPDSCPWTMEKILEDDFFPS